MRRVVPGLYMFGGLPPGRVYLITEGDGLTLVDTSLALAAGPILRQIRGLGYAPDSLRRILVTHAHPDHIGALPALVRATGAEVWASRIERPVIEGAIPMMRPPAQELRGVDRLMAGGSPSLFPHVPVARMLRDGEVLDEVFDGLQVIATPGHTPGHLSFWHPERRLVITGDVMMHLPTRLMLPVAAFTYDMAENIRSIGRVARLKPRVACFGHGTPMLAAAAKRLADFAQRVGAL